MKGFRRLDRVLVRIFWCEELEGFVVLVVVFVAVGWGGGGWFGF